MELSTGSTKLLLKNGEFIQIFLYRGTCLAQDSSDASSSKDKYGNTLKTIFSVPSWERLENGESVGHIWRLEESLAGATEDGLWTCGLDTEGSFSRSLFCMPVQEMPQDGGTTFYPKRKLVASDIGYSAEYRFSGGNMFATKREEDCYQILIVPLAGGTKPYDTLKINMNTRDFTVIGDWIYFREAASPTRRVPVGGGQVESIDG